MTADNTAIQETQNRPIDIFRAQLDRAASTIMPLLPKHISQEKFTSSVITTVAYNPKLQECTPVSLLRAVATAAELGLSLNPVMKECDILPVWSKDGTVAQCRPRYTGLMRLARQGGIVKAIAAHEVYEHDHFTYEYGLEPKLEHKPAAGDRGALTFAYCTWKMADGTVNFEVVDKKRIDRAKSASEGYKAFKANRIKSTPWVDDESEMWRKTAVHAAMKYIPQQTENDVLAKALSLDDTAFDEDLPKLTAAEPPAIAPPRPVRTPPPSVVAEDARQGNHDMDSQYRQTMGDAPPTVITPPAAITLDDEPQFPTGYMATNLATATSAPTGAAHRSVRADAAPQISTIDTTTKFTLIIDAKGNQIACDTIEEWEEAVQYRINNNKPSVVMAIAVANEQIIADVDADYPEAAARARAAFAAKPKK